MSSKYLEGFGCIRLLMLAISSGFGGLGLVSPVDSVTAGYGSSISTLIVVRMGLGYLGPSLLRAIIFFVSPHTLIRLYTTNSRKLVSASGAGRVSNN